MVEVFRVGEAVFSQEPGWEGVFTRHQAEGAFPNGTRVEKAAVELGDAHAIGERGTVLGSMREPQSGVLAYMVEWDDMPRRAVGVVAAKIRALA